MYAEVIRTHKNSIIVAKTAPMQFILHFTICTLELVVKINSHNITARTQCLTKEFGV